MRTSPSGWLDAEQASAVLGVKRSTLYTYASRGWIRTSRPGGRRRRYLEADVLELRRRADAHRGQDAAAAAALDWGPPVLSSAITSIDIDGPNYRGTPALTIAEQDWPFEQVASLLWQEASAWPTPPTYRSSAPVGHPLRALQHALLTLPTEPEPRPHHIIHALIAALGAPVSGTVAERVAAATGADSVPAVRAALCLAADHELNASTFAARVASSTGASLPDAVLAGLCTLSGPRHGGLSDRVERWIRDDCPLPPQAFGHALYPAGDPRGEHLVALALTLAPTGRRQVLRARLDAAGERRPTLDVGLAALAFATHARPHSGFAWFAVGRAAGWLAHIQEQRQQPGLLRPRARYAGP